MNRTIASWSGAHSCGDVHHNCTFVRLCARAREDVQGIDQAQITTMLKHRFRASLGHVFQEKDPLSNIRQLFANFS